MLSLFHGVSEKDSSIVRVSVLVSRRSGTENELSSHETVTAFGGGEVVKCEGDFFVFVLQYNKHGNLCMH